MAKQIINTGTVPDDGTGDNLRNSFVKVNANFTELYTYNANTANGGGLTGGTQTGALDSPNVEAHNLRFMFDGLSDLPSATTYHGMFAHVHATGHGYFAHGGSWVQLIDTSSSLTELTGITDGDADQVLTTDGAGNFTFEDGGGIGLSSRGDLAGTTASLADDVRGNLDIAGHKGYMLLSIKVDRAAWVRVYSHASARSADTGRAQDQDPAADAGVIAEVITTGAATVQIAPGALGYSFEATPSTTIPCSVTNLSGSTSTVVVTLSAIQLEA